MYPGKLKKDLLNRASTWASQNSFTVNTGILPAPVSAILFDKFEGNFHKDSLNAIFANQSWNKRLQKPHQKHGRLKFKEMHSSNSSDALLMNIFCHPKLKDWKEVERLLGQAITSIEFGYNPPLLKNGLREARPTEVDLLLNNKIICESKLTESGFTKKEKASVEAYDSFNIVFDTGKLKQDKGVYFNYQLIRNILAASTHNMEFVLLCDLRRPDLHLAFKETVGCIKDISLRTRCKIIFWQDLAAASESNLKKFLSAKYGL